MTYVKWAHISSFIDSLNYEDLLILVTQNQGGYLWTFEKISGNDYITVGVFFQQRVSLNHCSTFIYNKTS